jgi:hypothetical protein
MLMSWICPKCERELKKPNQGHYCAKVNLDDLLQGQSEELVLVVDKLLAEITDWDGVTVSCSPNCIVFVHRQTFFVIRPMKNQLDLKFYSEKIPEETFIKKSLLYAGRYANNIRITALNQLTPKVFTLIRGSYTLL